MFCVKAYENDPETLQLIQNAYDIRVVEYV